MNFFAELRRRSVFRVAGVYSVVGWLLAQISALLESALNLPGWFDGAVVTLLLLGFPVALILAWAFEVTPEGVRRMGPSMPDAPVRAIAGFDVFLVSAIIALIVVTGFQLGGFGAGRVPAAAGVASGDSPSIAVLPFADMSPDGDQEYFSDGLSEELLNQLAQLEGLRVTARTSSFAFKGQNVDIRTIGDSLEVRHVLQGSVRKADDELRISAQLIDTFDGSQVWSETYDRRLADIFRVQEDIARAVANALSGTLGIGVLSALVPPTEDVELYDRYLRARALLQRPGNSSDDYSRAAESLRDVLDVDPQFSRARADLTLAYFILIGVSTERAADVTRTLEDLVIDSLEQAPQDPSTQLAAAYLHLLNRRWLRADVAYARALELADGDSVGSVELQSMFFSSLGRQSEGIEVLESGLVDDPLNSVISNFLQGALTILGRNAEAEAEYRRAVALGIEVEPMTTFALYRAWNEDDDALTRERLDRVLEFPNYAQLVELRNTNHDPDAALGVVRAAYEALQDDAGARFLAVYLAHYGDVDLALNALRRAYTNSFVTPGTLWYPDFAALRREPGFKELVRALGLVDYWREKGNWGEFCRPLGDDDFECF